MIKLSDHSIERAWERFGLIKSELKDLATSAFYLGLHYADLEEDLARTSKEMKRIEESDTGHGEKTVLFFDNKLFVFKKNTLVTITKIDKKDLKKYE